MISYSLTDHLELRLLKLKGVRSLKMKYRSFQGTQAPVVPERCSCTFFAWKTA